MMTRAQMANEFIELLRKHTEHKAALRKYGRHEYTCVTTNYDDPSVLVGIVCDCGLGAALAEQETK